MFDFETLITYLPALLKGALITLELSIIVIVLSSITGTGMALMRISEKKTLKKVSSVYVWIFRGTPQLLTLFYIYYTFPHIGIVIPAFAAAIIGLTLNSTAYYGEIIRSGIEAIPKGQIEASIALGMSYSQIFRKVVFPQAVRIIIPPYINNSILLLKNTSLVSVITVSDLMLNAEKIYSATYRPIEILTAAGVIYLIMTSGLMLLQSWSEKKLSYYSR